MMMFKDGDEIELCVACMTVEIEECSFSCTHSTCTMMVERCFCCLKSRCLKAKRVQQDSAEKATMGTSIQHRLYISVWYKGMLIFHGQQNA